MTLRPVLCACAIVVAVAASLALAQPLAALYPVYQPQLLLVY